MRKKREDKYTPAVCVQCGVTYLRARSIGRFCSNKCRWKARDLRPEIKANKAARVRNDRQINGAKYCEYELRKYRKHRDSILAEKKRYFQRAKPRILEARRNHRHANVRVALRYNLQTRIGHALRKQSADKSGRCRDLVGCSPMQLRNYLTALFLPGMSWENRHLWHIDHIRPCASFDLSDPEQQKACFHYTNLQPLWIEDNLRKGARG